MFKKIILGVLLVALPAYLAWSIFFLDRYDFICPIKYERDYAIRNDSRGDGAFAAERSGRRTHEGVDLLASIGTPVLAARSGRVIAAKQTRGMGKYVIIRHRGGMTTIYGHLSGIDVNRGQIVRQGQTIGRVGKTGNANYRAILPHLHFEVRECGTPKDPLQYLQ